MKCQLGEMMSHELSQLFQREQEFLGVSAEFSITTNYLIKQLK